MALVLTVASVLVIVWLAGLIVYLRSHVGIRTWRNPDAATVGPFSASDSVVIPLAPRDAFRVATQSLERVRARRIATTDDGTSAWGWVGAPINLGRRATYQLTASVEKDADGHSVVTFAARPVLPIGRLFLWPPDISEEWVRRLVSETSPAQDAPGGPLRGGPPVG